MNQRRYPNSSKNNGMSKLLPSSCRYHQRGYMFAMLLAVLALMAILGVGLTRLLEITKATTQMQRAQETKQILHRVTITLSARMADADSDNVLEPPAFSTATIPGFAAPTNGGFVGTVVTNLDAWGRRLGYCAYDYGQQPTTAVSGLIRGSDAVTPTVSWVAVVVISAGSDGVITTSCPAADTPASAVQAQGDDIVAARNYEEMVSFGNAQIAATFAGVGTNYASSLCRMNNAGKLDCDIPSNLTDNNTVRRICRTNASGTVTCDGIYNTSGGDLACTANQKLTLTIGNDSHPEFTCQDLVNGCSLNQIASSWSGSQVSCTTPATCPFTPGNQYVSTWNGSAFSCVKLRACSDSAGNHESGTSWNYDACQVKSCYNGTTSTNRAPCQNCGSYLHGSSWANGCQTQSCYDGNVSTYGALCGCAGGYAHGATWTSDCINYSCNNGSISSSGSSCPRANCTVNGNSLPHGESTFRCGVTYTCNDGRVSQSGEEYPTGLTCGINVPGTNGGSCTITARDECGLPTSCTANVSGRRSETCNILKNGADVKCTVQVRGTNGGICCIGPGIGGCNLNFLLGSDGIDRRAGTYWYWSNGRNYNNSLWAE